MIGTVGKYHSLCGALSLSIILLQPTAAAPQNSPPTAPTRIARPGAAAAANTSPSAGSDVRISRPGEFKQLQPSVDNYKPVAPPQAVPGSAPPKNTGTGSQSAPPPSPVPGSSVSPNAGAGGNQAEQYPTIGRLEEVTIGHAQPYKNINERLGALESVVFKKTFTDDSLFDRTDRLKRTILGIDDPTAQQAKDEYFDSAPTRETTQHQYNQAVDPAQAAHYLDELARNPDNLQPATAEAVALYAVELVNNERRNYGIAPITPDVLAEKLAREHVTEQARRQAISHFSEKGDGPDRRYTLAEGTDSLTECVASLRTTDTGSRGLTKAAAALMLKSLIGRQDDRDALLSPDATHLGFAVALSASGERIYGTFEVVNRHGVMGPIPAEAIVGDKLEVKGVIHSPYIFDRVTVAWENYNPEGMSAAGDESEEALPYFPPLDYVAYASRSEQNYDRAITTLKAVGMVAAIAGGVFMPPVALAAPLIAMAGTSSEPRPVSDIPVKGGVKLDGAQFTAKIPLNNANKDGLYYVTVWGALGKGQKSVPVSRRVILVKDKHAVETALAGEKLTREESQRDEKEADREEEREKKKKNESTRDLKKAPETAPEPNALLEAGSGVNTGPDTASGASAQSAIANPAADSATSPGASPGASSSQYQSTTSGEAKPVATDEESEKVRRKAEKEEAKRLARERKEEEKRKREKEKQAERGKDD